MSKYVTIKKDEESGEYYIDLNDLTDLFDDINTIDYYLATTLEDGSLVFSFFDKDDNEIFPKKYENS